MCSSLVYENVRYQIKEFWGITLQYLILINSGWWGWGWIPDLLYDPLLLLSAMVQSQQKQLSFVP